MQENEIITAIREHLSKAAPGARAFLYGSRARGTAKEDSDWDVLILLDKPKVTFEDHSRIVYPLEIIGFKMNQEINPMLCTEEYWRQSSFTPFHHNVSKDCIAI